MERNMQDAVEAGRLVGWIGAARPDHGLRFLEDSGVWSFVSYAEAGRLAHAVAAQIEAHALTSRTPVAIVLPNGPAFVAAFYGTLLSGRGACPLAPHLAFGDSERYLEHVANVLRLVRPSLVLTDVASAELLTAAARRGGHAAPLLTLDAAALAGDAAATDRPTPAVDPAPSTECLPPVALVQFTSGSTGRPRGAMVSSVNLEANLAMNARWLAIEPSDSFASWLPMFHDMGLIGSLTMIAEQIDLWIMRPEQFIRSPVTWLACFGRRSCTLGVSPTFGLAYAARKLLEGNLDGFDFSRWRTIVVGSDPVRPTVLAAFADRLRPHGFSLSTFVPAYGLAEATLSVAGRSKPAMPSTSSDDAPTAARLEWEELRFGQRVRIRERAVMTAGVHLGDADGWITSCGPPHPELSVSVLDERGAALPQGWLGEIVISGPSIVERYVGDDAAHTSACRDGLLHTGDAGFVLDGELYILGRLGDSIKVRGRSVFAEDLDARLASLPRISRGRSVTLSGLHRGRPTIVAVVESEPGGWQAVAARVIKRGLSADVDVTVVAAPPGTIVRTSSGKPRRREMWTAFVNGRLPVLALYDGVEEFRGDTDALSTLAAT